MRCIQWVKKLSQLPSDDLELGKIRNEYIQLLRIQVQNRFLHGIFKGYPPDSEKLTPLAEVLGNNIAKQVDIHIYSSL